MQGGGEVAVRANGWVEGEGSGGDDGALAKAIAAFELRRADPSTTTLNAASEERQLPSIVTSHHTVTMSGKYAFTKGLKELRFLHCQTSEHSNAVRYGLDATQTTNSVLTRVGHS